MVALCVRRLCAAGPGSGQVSCSPPDTVSVAGGCWSLSWILACRSVIDCAGRVARKLSMTGTPTAPAVTVRSPFFRAAVKAELSSRRVVTMVSFAAAVVSSGVDEGLRVGHIVQFVQGHGEESADRHRG